MIPVLVATAEDEAKLGEAIRGRLVMGFKDILENGNATGGVKASARITVAGYDIDVLDKGGVITDAPTISKQGAPVATQIGVSMGWKSRSGDVSGAFLQGGPLETPVLAAIPHEVCMVHGLLRGAKVVMVKAGFGMDNGPRKWCGRAYRDLKGTGAKRNVLDKGLYAWYRDGKLCAMLMMHVGDFRTFADERWYAEVFPFLPSSFESVAVAS